MPIYQYQCANCNSAGEEFQKMTTPALTQCPKCLRHEYHRVPTLPHTDLKEFHTPIEMLSIAMEDPEEIKDFIRKTGMDVSLDPDSPSYGIPIATNRSQKRKALEAAGFAEKN